ncbi:DNA segregation ATPase FtsK/SpoIIIE, S-DNA-T family [Marinactinospora thermotolerans DSM 45154]|uniref:DNA segregation ATPase FtsK/SpoIIIE, S-DNA-T family n=1 Tax=Marinactinospora thermotolerans DSM 45154 TaxID=1122192 RepID=A0A1T4SST6_9ACTN|nr:FtsK/SpoIIIE domain-containing protein [Marinactinospora thermotolerans]SKA30951.1 DNA segregation ATPase FtsK/SpoIIIE, S-DNA-T family [Marinactinospora thermotolerans DSM 45154]
MLRNNHAGAAQTPPTLPMPAQAFRFSTPVVETPGIFVLASWIIRLLRVLVLAPIRFPVAVGSTAALTTTGYLFGTVGLTVTVIAATSVLLTWRTRWPLSFHRLVALRVLAAWRWITVYRRHWQPVLVVAGLAESYQERRYLPRIRKVTCSSWADRVRVRLVAGTAPADVEQRVAELAHGFGAASCRVTVLGPRDVVLEFPRHDTLADPLDALPIPRDPDLAALPVGRREDGEPWHLRLHGTHVLVVGVTGAGKGSVLWSVIRAMSPAVRDGTAQVWAVDPKRMELSYGRGLFARYADTGETAVALLETAVAGMQDRAERYAGRQRAHVPTVDDPFVVVVLDEVAFLTAYHPDRDVRRRAENAIATLTSQGRSVGFCVLAALQDPRKEVMNLRNLFPDKIALRLDEASQVDMVLGEGARERGANAHLIDPDLPGVAFVRVEGSPIPVRVRAAYVCDDDIDTMVTEYGAAPLRPVSDEGAA